MNVLRFCFKSENCNGWPQIRFIIDNDVHAEHAITQSFEYFDLSIDLLPGNHCLDIERYGKRIPDNIVYRDGQILQDQITTLTDIYLDNIKLPDMIKYSGIFKYDDHDVPGGLSWGPNGIWSLQFETPLLNWVIETKQKQQHVIDLLDYESRASLIQKLEEFEQTIKNASTIPKSLSSQ